ncbi:MAG: GNAT family protein [Rhodothermales bacterium]|nr:GNAT family protein [Rhodothermales bacterium]
MEANYSDGRILIRPYAEADAGALYEAARESVAEVGLWLPWCHEGYSRRDAAAWIAECPARWLRGEEHAFAIVEAGTGRYLGGVGLNAIHPLHRFANLGYWVRTTAAGRGTATAAARLAAAFGFRALGLVRVEIVVAVANAASLRVAEKTGAQREGILRRRLVCGERVDDAVLFSLIPDDLSI